MKVERNAVRIREVRARPEPRHGIIGFAQCRRSIGQYHRFVDAAVHFVNEGRSSMPARTARLARVESAVGLSAAGISRRARDIAGADVFFERERDQRPPRDGPSRSLNGLAQFAVAPRSPRAFVRSSRQRAPGAAEELLIRQLAL